MHKNTLLKNLHRFKTATPFKEQTVVKDHVSEGCLMTQEITQDPTWNEKSYNSKLKLRVYPDAGFRVIFFPVPFSKISSLSAVSLDFALSEKKKPFKAKDEVGKSTHLPWTLAWAGPITEQELARDSAWFRGPEGLVALGGLRRRQGGIRNSGAGGLWSGRGRASVGAGPHPCGSVGTLAQCPVLVTQGLLRLAWMPQGPGQSHLMLAARGQQRIIL